MEKNRCKKLVVKHNKLIQYKGKMELNELKLFSLIIADVREMQKEAYQEYDIDVGVLKDKTNHKGFFDYIKNVALKLKDKTIVIDEINENNERYFNTIQLINKPRYTEGSNKLIVDIDKDLIPYIIDLKREFTRYEIENILRLQSKYSIRIYELVKQYEVAGIRVIPVKQLREYLGITEDEYNIFSNFEKRVLTRAKKEINKCTDISIDYKKIKKGRRIDAIQFIIQSDNQEKKEYIEYLDKTYPIKEMKIRMGVTEEHFNSEQIVNIYTKAKEKLEKVDLDQDKYIYAYIDRNYIYMQMQKDVKKRYGYLISALNDDYAKAEERIKVMFDL